MDLVILGVHIISIISYVCIKNNLEEAKLISRLSMIHLMGVKPPKNGLTMELLTMPLHALLKEQAVISVDIVTAVLTSCWKIV